MNIESYQYNPIIESIVDTLVVKTQNSDRNFFRLQANFYMSLIPSSMHLKVRTPFTGSVPVNFYGVNLASSGSGKGHSTNFLENEVLAGFKSKFTGELFPLVAELNIEREALNSSLPDAEEKLKREFDSYGALRFAFDSATTPAIKQFRHKILMAKLGALNYIIDEIGANLKSNEETLHTYLELYDKGLIKDKLTKNTQDNSRAIERGGETPTNLLMFGTPSKLLDGAATENLFFDLLEMGYARRCFFAYSKKEVGVVDVNPSDLYDSLCNPDQENAIFKLAAQLEILADTQMCNKTIELQKDLCIKLLEYKLFCEKRAANYGEHQEIFKSEMMHRYFKVLKLAATYAFIEGTLFIRNDHLEQAIKFAEDSGEALVELMNRPKPYERLAKFIASGKGKTFTQVDLVEELPYYKGTSSQKNELMSMAVAWGYVNNIIIKKTVLDDVEFFSGESLEETDLDKIIISYSQHFGDGYINKEVSWNTAFDKLIPCVGYHWINHFSVDGNRRNDSMKEGFNLVVLDIDGGCTVKQAQDLLKDYTYIIHTTKRHLVPDPETGEVCERFRVLLPTNYKLFLNEVDYKKFMENVKQWSPFELDDKTFQRSRKWSCASEGQHLQMFKNSGKLLDVLPFIPKTSREADFNKANAELQSLSNIERWFVQQIADGGNRNNNLLRYAYMLADGGVDYDTITGSVLTLNKKLSYPLPEDEIKQTIFVSLSKKFLGR